MGKKGISIKNGTQNLVKLPLWLPCATWSATIGSTNSPRRCVQTNVNLLGQTQVCPLDKPGLSLGRNLRRDTSTPDCSFEKHRNTAPICIAELLQKYGLLLGSSAYTTHSHDVLPFVSWYFRRSIGVRGWWNTCKLCMEEAKKVAKTIGSRRVPEQACVLIKCLCPFARKWRSRAKFRAGNEQNTFRSW